MKVLLSIKNRFRILVALQEEFQVLFGFSLTYPTETYPWSFSMWFLCFEFEWLGRWKRSHNDEQLRLDLGPGSEDPDWYYDDDA